MKRLLLAVLLIAIVLLIASNNFVFWTSKQALNAFWRFKTKEYTALSGPGFTLRFSPALDKINTAAVLEASTQYSRLMNDYFGTSVSPPLLILVSKTELNEYAGGGYSLNSAGIYQKGVIVLGVGNDGESGFAQTLVHELAHHYVDNIAWGNYPTWYGEGMAQRMEIEFIGKVWFDGTYNNNYYKYSISELLGDFHKLEDQVSAYRQALQLVLAMEELGGGQAIQAVLRDLSQGRTFSHAIKTRIGCNQQELYEYAFGQEQINGG